MGLAPGRKARSHLGIESTQEEVRRYYYVEAIDRGFEGQLLILTSSCETG
jgi:hypothetical protein